jgi:hypothetical protein
MDDVDTHLNWLTQFKNVHFRLIYTAGNSSDGDLNSKMIKSEKGPYKKIFSISWQHSFALLSLSAAHFYLYQQHNFISISSTLFCSFHLAKPLILSSFLSIRMLAVIT